MIIFDQVTKSYPTGNTVLDNVSFNINPGEFVVITGNSGAGKTTIGRLLIHDLTPTSGHIRVGDWDLSKIKDKDQTKLRQFVGVVFQDYKIIPDKTVFENISLALEIINYPHKKIEERVNHLLDLVGIPDKKNLFPSQLSGGELQRAAIARAVVNEPKVLFADEPTGNLDDTTGDEIYKLLRAIHALGTTVIMSTHNLRFLDHGNRHIHLENGKIVTDSISNSGEKGSQEPHEQRTSKHKKHK